jgi:diguanylate cyclase (GGDEF)-like protein
VNILLIDDDEDEFILLRGIFSLPRGRDLPRDVNLQWVGTYEEALSALGDPAYDVFLLDYRLGERSGLDLLRRAAEVGCRAPIIVLTGQGDDAVDLAAMQLGAANYLAKDQISLPLLEHSIRYALEQTRTRHELEQRAAELVRLQAATATLLETLDLETLLTQILDSALRVVPPAENSWLYLADVASFFSAESLDPARDPAARDARIREYNPDRHVSAPSPHDPGAGDCIEIDDTRGRAYLHAFGHELATPGEARSALVVSLALDDEPPARLVLGAARPAAFSAADRRLLATFAATASLALKNGLLHRREHTHAITDPLTGQLNRRQFLALGQREIERYHRYGHELALILFDIDHLKEINDAFGHATGDQVIRTVAERCHAALRQVDILGRLGGDEFAVILPELENAAEKAIAERIRHIISDVPVATDAGPLSVSVSLGITRISQAASDLNGLLSLADKALYRAKNAGRNNIEVADENL